MRGGAVGGQPFGLVRGLNLVRRPKTRHSMAELLAIYERLGVTSEVLVSGVTAKGEG